MKKTKKDYDPNIVGMTLFKFFHLLKGSIIEREGKIGWIVECTNIRLFHGLNDK